MPTELTSSYVVHGLNPVYDSTLLGVWRNRSVAERAAQQHANKRPTNESILEQWRGPLKLHSTIFTWLPDDINALTCEEKHGTLHHVSLWALDETYSTIIITNDIHQAQAAGFTARDEHPNPSNYLQVLISTWENGVLQPPLQILYSDSEIYQIR